MLTFKWIWFFKFLRKKPKNAFKGKIESRSCLYDKISWADGAMVAINAAYYIIVPDALIYSLRITKICAIITHKANEKQ